MTVREELKESYIFKIVFFINEKLSDSELKQLQKNSIEGRKYLIGGPSKNDADLSNGHSIKIIGQNHENK
jgi:hypothetical protein